MSDGLAPVALICAMLSVEFCLTRPARGEDCADGYDCGRNSVADRGGRVKPALACGA